MAHLNNDPYKKKRFGIGHVRDWRRSVFKTVQVLVVIPVSLFHKQMDNSSEE
jgi:hypothetical protein